MPEFHVNCTEYVVFRRKMSSFPPSYSQAQGIDHTVRSNQHGLSPTLPTGWVIHCTCSKCLGMDPWATTYHPLLYKYVTLILLAHPVLGSPPPQYIPVLIRVLCNLQGSSAGPLLEREQILGSYQPDSDSVNSVSWGWVTCRPQLSKINQKRWGFFNSQQASWFATFSCHGNSTSYVHNTSGAKFLPRLVACDLASDNSHEWLGLGGV